MYPAHLLHVCFKQPLYVEPEGGGAVEGKDIPAGVVLPPDGSHITETADAAMREAKRKQAAFYQLRNVQKTKWMVGGGVALFLLLIIIIAASVSKKKDGQTLWDATPSVRAAFYYYYHYYFIWGGGVL